MNKLITSVCVLINCRWHVLESTCGIPVTSGLPTRGCALDFNKFLLDLGEGKLPAHATVEGYNLIEIPPSMCEPLKDEVIEKVFDHFQSHIGDPEYFQGRIFLATTNKIVDEVNDEMVERIPGDLHTFHCIDTVTDVANCTMFRMEFFRFCMQRITFAKNHSISLFGKCLFSHNFCISSAKPGFF